MYIFLYYTVGILWTAKEEFHCIIENMFLYCAYDNKHFESLNLNFLSFFYCDSFILFTCDVSCRLFVLYQC